MLQKCYFYIEICGLFHATPINNEPWDFFKGDAKIGKTKK
jgi:hypothetical protein